MPPKPCTTHASHKRKRWFTWVAQYLLWVKHSRPPGGCLLDPTHHTVTSHSFDGKVPPATCQWQWACGAYRRHGKATLKLIAAAVAGARSWPLLIAATEPRPRRLATSPSHSLVRQWLFKVQALSWEDATQSNPTGDKSSIAPRVTQLRVPHRGQGSTAAPHSNEITRAAYHGAHCS